MWQPDARVLVCPLIESSEVLEVAAATETFERITQMLPDLRIGLLHGEMPPATKTEVMQRFEQCELDLLVATTVIEVGVDVPNATLMVIEHAERFGLAQLHQLRACRAAVAIRVLHSDVRGATFRTSENSASVYEPMCFRIRGEI